MGKLCREHGFTFTQVGASAPFLQKGRLKVECRTHFDVPLINPSRRSLSEMREELDSRGEPENLFDECFQEEEVVPKGHGPESALGDDLESDGPPELEESTDEETPRVKSEGGKTKRSRPKSVQKETSCDLGEHNLTHFSQRSKV